MAAPAIGHLPVSSHHPAFNTVTDLLRERLARIALLRFSHDRVRSGDSDAGIQGVP